MSMTPRQLIEALSQFYEDVMDTEILIEDEYGNTASITDVVDANGIFIHPSKNFEEDTGLLDSQEPEGKPRLIRDKPPVPRPEHKQGPR